MLAYAVAIKFWGIYSYSRIQESRVRSKNCSSSDFEVEEVYFTNLLACCIKNWVKWCKTKTFSEEQLQEYYSYTRIKVLILPLIPLTRLKRKSRGNKGSDSDVFPRKWSG
jgi:hypothetical protein